jgi:hypothetical protein
MGALKSYRCSKGHVLSASNTYKKKHGQRECKKCSLERRRAWAERRGNNGKA